MFELGSEIADAWKREVGPPVATSLQIASLPDGIVLNAVPALVALVDGDGVIAWASDAWKRSSDEDAWPGSVGENYLHVCESAAQTGADARRQIAPGLRAVLEGRTAAFELEYPLVTSPGERWLRVTASPVVQRGFRGAVVMHIEFAPRPPENGAARTDEQIAHSQKMEAVGRLAGGVAHDFANLLTMISGYSEMLLMRMNALDPLRPEIEEIRKAANRGTGLTSQLLSFSRRQQIEPRVLDLNFIVIEMEKMLRRIIGEHIELRISLDPVLGKIKADPGQMEQVLMNLAVNARDAMPRGGAISIATANLQLEAESARARAIPPGAYVALTFRDTGEGMDQETLAQAFEPFFTTKEPGQGTGLGLSTVSAVVKQSRGDIRAESEPGKGSVFTICLPVVGEPAAAAPPAPDRRPAVGNETILLVEDEEGVRRLLKHVLTRLGYQVLEAPGGAEALAVLERCGPIHLLLTDMVMPRMSGRELAECALRARPELKVLYMSGYTDDVLMHTGALGPGMSFLQKPLRPESLAQRIRQVLDQTVRTR